MRSTSRSVGSLLSSMPTLKAISVQLDRIAAMQHVLDRALQGAHAKHVRVAYEDGKTLVLAADSAAAAARTRHLAPRLAAALRQHFPTVAGIRCEVGIVQRTSGARASARRITPTGKHALAALAGSLPEGELKHALERLLRGADASDREDQPLQREEGERDGRYK